MYGIQHDRAAPNGLIFMLFAMFGYRILPMMPPGPHFAHRCVGMTDLFESSAGEKNPNSWSLTVDILFYSTCEVCSSVRKIAETHMLHCRRWRKLCPHIAGSCMHPDLHVKLVGHTDRHSFESAETAGGTPQLASRVQTCCMTVRTCSPEPHGVPPDPVAFAVRTERSAFPWKFIHFSAKQRNGQTHISFRTSSSSSTSF